MPVANPSGFVRNLRNEFPSGIDANRDFPFDTQSDSCLRGVTSRLMDYIYRRWSIDMTITLHQGGEEIGWNWAQRCRKAR